MLNSQKTADSINWQEKVESPLPRCLAEIKEEWEDIYREMDDKSPFSSFQYVRLWYDCFADPDSIRIIRVQDSGSVLGFLPLVLRPEAGRRELHNLTNNHCLHFSPLVRPQDTEKFFLKAIESLKEDQSSWDTLQLDWMHSFTSQSCFTSQDILNHTQLKWDRIRQPNFTIDLTGSFDDFFASRSSQLRTNLRRHMRHLAEAGEGQFIHLRDDEAIRSFGDFVEVEDSGWKAASGSSIARTETNYRKYYRGLIQLLASQNALHLYFLELNGEKIAAVFGYTEGALFHYTKIGYREKYAKLSPSNLLLLHMIRDIKKNQTEVRHFHLFPDGGRYKHRWVNEQSETFAITLFSNSIRGRTSYIGVSARRALKNISWLKRVVKSMRSMGKG